MSHGLAFPQLSFSFFFFFNDTATTEIYTLSLHDALPIFLPRARHPPHPGRALQLERPGGRSEEHTSELQSRRDLVCRLLLEKKKKTSTQRPLHELKHLLRILRQTHKCVIQRHRLQEGVLP